ncbi:MAG TPA: hypothetical protein VH136_14550 [Trebonia sp.]|nr:hypothetical protein [Trebonia sp.]
MTPAERVVRAATRAYGETVTEVRPLDLTAAAKPGERHVRLRRRRRFPGWLAPFAAAAAVVALAISLVIVRNIPDRPAPASGVVPRYYAALVPQPPQGFQNKLTVGDTLTGARLATLTPARGNSFSVVTAAADDRTFVVATKPIDTGAPDNRVPPRTWYLLRIVPGTSSQVRLTRLPIPDLKGDDVLAVALSGSGREIALGFIPNYATSPQSPVQLRVYSVTTGKLERAWSTSDQTVFAGPGRSAQSLNTALTWVDDDRALAFPTISAASDALTHQDVIHETVRLLDMSAGGGDLIADSRVIWSTQRESVPITDQHGQLSCVNNLSILPMLTADGKTIVCAAIKSPNPQETITAPGPQTLAWLAYSTSSPTVARTLAQVTVDVPSSTTLANDLLWADSSGGTLIGTWTLEMASVGFIDPNPPPAYRPHWGVIADGKFRPLTTMGDLNLYSGIAW